MPDYAPLSGLRRRDDLADAAFRVAVQERHDVLAHPRSANVAGDPGGIFGAVEHEDQNEVPVIDLGHLSGTGTGVDNTAHCVPRLLDELRRHRVAQMKMVHDDVHGADSIQLPP
jgi:hypothetical protein